MDQPKIIDAKFKVVNTAPRFGGFFFRAWAFLSCLWVLAIHWATAAPPEWYATTAATPTPLSTYIGPPLAVFALGFALKWVLGLR